MAHSSSVGPYAQCPPCPPWWRASSPAFVLCLTRPPEFWIGAMLEQQIRPLLVIEDSSESVTKPRCGQPRRHACLAHRVHIGTLFDEEFEERVPTAVRRAEQRVLAVGCG